MLFVTYYYIYFLLGIVNNARFLTQDSRALRSISDDDTCGMLNAVIGPGPSIIKILLPRMLERNRGAIVSISPLDVLFPVPFGHISSTANVIRLFSFLHKILIV